MAITPRSLLHRSQSSLRCHVFHLHDHHCSHPLASGWWVQTVPNPFTGYTEEAMPKHAAPRVPLLTRLKLWLYRLIGPRG